MVSKKSENPLSARDQILDAVRRNRPPEVPLPDYAFGNAPADDLISHFESVSKEIAGEVLYATSTEVEALLLDRYGSAGRIVSTIPEIAFGNLPIQPETDPKKLHPLDIFLCRGEFGVVENGAIWVAESSLVVRAAPFLAEHLIILLDQAQIVATMHDAYNRLRIDEEKFGIFIAGPSKTGDIEHSMVVGAHGPRKHTVVLYSAQE